MRASAAKAARKITAKSKTPVNARLIGPEEMGVSEYRLDNGLKVLLAPNHSAPVVTFMQLFRVGSRDEGVGHTGATHFLEHMMFKGTRKFDPQNGLDSTELLNRIGAVSNATTWFDRTNYFETVPSEYLEFCIKVEADRMRNLRLRQSDRDAEMSVVRNELERGENSPEEALDKEIYAISYREHPYHHPTIGWRSDVEKVPMERLKAFYDTFYWPNNCTVIVVGDFETGAVLKLIEKYYGKIEKSPRAIPDVYTIEPPQEGERRFKISRSGDLCRVWVAHRTPASRHPDHHALNVISHLLGGSHDRSSRLYKALIDSGLAMDAACRHDELRDPALMIVAATLTPDADPGLVEKVILDELERLKTEAVSEAELAPIKSANRKGSILARADQLELAFALGEAEARDSWRWLSSFDHKFEAVLADDIISVAKKYFEKDSRTVGIFIPKPEAEEDFEEEINEGESETLEKKKSRKNGKRVPKLSAQELEKILCPARASSRKSFSSQVHRETLENGMSVLHMANPGTGSVAVSLYIPCGNYYEPPEKHGLADVVSDMLMRGSEDLDKESLAQILKEMGLLEGLNIHTNSFSVNTASTVVVEDLGQYLKTLSLVLQKPVFKEEELSRLKNEWIARILEQKNNTGPQASNRFFRELYPEGHLFHQIDFDEQIRQLQSMDKSDLQFFHANYSPASAIMTIVGDIDCKKALELVTENFASWNGPEAQVIKLESVEMPEKAKSFEIRLPDKSSMDILMGYPLKVRRSDPDFYALNLANLALGGDTIIGRLGKVLREENGLTYGIYSSLGDCSYGAAPWTISLTVNPQNAKLALSLVHEVLNKYRKSGISADELKREATGAAGLFTVSLRSSVAIARIITRFEALGLGLEGLDLHTRKILSVKKAEVDEAIRKYLHPERMLTVMAGSF